MSNCCSPRNDIKTFAKTATLLFCVGFLFLGLAGQASAATYYVSPTGSNIAPYDTWAKAANLPHTVIALNPAGGPHIVLIGPGNYASYINPTNANWNSGIIFGISAAGVAVNADGSNYQNYPAAQGEVSISAPAGYHAWYNTASGMHLSYIELTGTDATHDLLQISGTGFVGRYLHLLNSGRRLMYLGSTGIDIMYFLAEGSVQGIKTSATGSGTLSSGIVRNSTTNYASSNVYSGFTSSSSGDFVLNNMIIMGSIAYAVEQSGIGNTTINNSMVFAGHNAYVALQTAGTLTFNNSYLVTNQMRPADMFTGTVTVNNSITNAYPSFVRRQRTGFIIPSMDDGGDIQYKLDVATELKARGMKGTWYIEGHALTGDTLTAAQTLIADGTIEIGGHSYSHSNLTLTGNVFTVTKAGKTINVDRTTAGGTITISDTGTVTGFKAKTLAAIRTELTALGCTLGALQTRQYDYALGEIMADSSGAQVSPYSPQYLIDATAATGLFKAEITDPKAAMEAALGVTLYSFSTPGGVNSADLSAAVLAAGYTSSRINISATGSNSLLSSINLGSLPYYATMRSLPDDVTVQQYMRDIAESVADLGCIYPDLMHTATERTIAQWRVALDVIAQYPEVIATSMYDAVNTIKTSGNWTTADNRTYTRTWTDNSDYNLLYTSPNIDTGTDVGLTTDYAGNSIYGTPDIGAYEYQPPYTIGTNEVDVSAEVRVYADGKFRNIGTVGGTTADLTITPNSGSFTSDKSAWMDVTDITWNTTGNYSKQWTESSTFSGLTNTVHTIGDLEANTYYNITVDSSITNLSGTNCNTAGSSYTCLSNSKGEITFTYLGTYSTHTFNITEGDNTVPVISGVTSAPTNTGATITWNTDEASSSLVEYGLTSSYGTSTSEADTGTRVTSHSVLLSNLSTCTRYYYRVHSKDTTTNESIVVGNSFLTTECGGGGLPSGAYTPPTSPAGGFKVSVNSNGNTETTNSPNVTLSLTAGTDVKNMAISNFPDFTNATQELYQPTKQWDLCQQRTTCPAGQYTVYVKFYTQYGQVSETAQDTINKTTSPTTQTTPTMSAGQRAVLIAQIRQQLISLITQLIQMLYLEVEQMRK